MTLRPRARRRAPISRAAEEAARGPKASRPTPVCPWLTWLRPICASPAAVRKNLLDDQDLTTGRLDTRFSGPSSIRLAKGRLRSAELGDLFGLRIALQRLRAPRPEVWRRVRPICPKRSSAQRSGTLCATDNPIDLNVSADLANAMKTNPKFHVMVNGGYYDLATPFYAAFYEEKHLPISASLGQEYPVRLVRVRTHGLRAGRVAEAASRPGRHFHSHYANGWQIASDN